MRRTAHLRLVDQSADDALRKAAQALLEYNFEDLIPEDKLIDLQTALNASSMSKLITSTAAKRLREAKSGLEYHNAFVDLMITCRAIIY